MPPGWGCFYCLLINTVLCVPERMGTEESAAISKNVSAIFTILFLINMSITLGNLCKKSLVNQSNGLEDLALNVDTKNTQNLELLLFAAISQNSLQWK